MGTNYYCETGRMLEVECDCGFKHMMPETLHIGKSSCGWTFLLHAIPEKGLECWRDWEEGLKAARRVYDEEGEGEGKSDDALDVILNSASRVRESLQSLTQASTQGK